MGFWKSRVVVLIGFLSWNRDISTVRFDSVSVLFSPEAGQIHGTHDGGGGEFSPETNIRQIHTSTGFKT